jgi:hypothetical protein
MGLQDSTTVQQDSATAQQDQAIAQQETAPKFSGFKCSSAECNHISTGSTQNVQQDPTTVQVGG